MIKFENSIQFKDDYRKYLEENGITSAHIARKMDISPQQLNNVWKKKELTVVDLKRLCDAINLKCDVIITKK